MTTAVKTGFGVEFAVGDAASPEVFTKVAEVLSVGGPSLSRDTPEATHTDSTAGYKEFIAGMKDGGEVTVTMNFLPADATQKLSGGLLGDFATDTLINYKITFPSSPTVAWTFAGLMTGFEPDVPIDDRMTASVSFKVSGQPTLA
jgi:predicted secreted protein